MKLRKLGTWSILAALLLVAAFSLAACGGDDDDSGGDDSGDSGKTSSGTGSDEKYVADLCKATLEFSKAFEKLDPSKVKSEDDVQKLFAEPFENYAKAMSKAKPPKDVKEYHDQVVKALNDTVKSMKSGDGTSGFEALADMDFPEPPAAVSDRLSKIADNNKDCKEANFDF